MRILLGAYSLICLTLILMMDLGQAVPFHQAVLSAPLGDKLLHACFAGVLALLLNITLLRLQSGRRWRVLATGTLLAAAVCTAEEATNLMTPYRGCELLDLVANYTGILLIGLAPLALWSRPAPHTAAL